MPPSFSNGSSGFFSKQRLSQSMKSCSKFAMFMLGRHYTPWNAKRLGTNILFSSQTALYVLKNPRWRKIKRRIFRKSTPLSPLFTRKRLWLSFIEHEALYKWFEVDGVSFNHCVTGHWIWKWRAVTQIQLILWNPQYCRCSKWQRVLPCSRSSGM